MEYIPDNESILDAYEQEEDRQSRLRKRNQLNYECEEYGGNIECQHYMN